MTDTLSEREKELVEAARMMITLDEDTMNGVGLFYRIDNLNAALKAYDPKPEPVPVIPEWKEFVNIIARDPSVAGVALKDPDFLRIDEAQYNAIRKATARMPD